MLPVLMKPSVTGATIGELGRDNDPPDPRRLHVQTKVRLDTKTRPLATADTADPNCPSSVTTPS